MVNYWHYQCSSFYFKFYLIIFILFLFDWFISIIKESVNGFHTSKVQEGILKGMVLFILSEVMFFFSIFWAFFSFKLNPSVLIFCTFPPEGINIIKADCFPLLNTVFLVYSGILLSNSILYLKKNLIFKSIFYLFFVIIFGVFFVLVQFIEYSNSYFSFNDSCYGSVFFFLTGFHGFHVIVGLIFLIICFYRMLTNLKNYKEIKFKKLKIIKFNLYKKFFIKLFKHNKNYLYLKNLSINKDVTYSKYFYTWKSILVWIDYHKINKIKYSNNKLNIFINFFRSRVSNNNFLLNLIDFKLDSNIGLICASWYWHFVDLIWIFVMSIIYSDFLVTIVNFKLI